MKKKIGYGLIFIVVMIQFFRIDKKNPEVNIENDFVAIHNPPEEVSRVLKVACYDCHSNTTEYPWYSNVAPLSWWLKDHIEEGRGELNFSEWGTYNDKRSNHKLEEIIETVEEDEMPLKEYTWTHVDAKLSIEQKKALIQWVQKLKENNNLEAEEETEINQIHLNEGQRWEANIETVDAIENMIAILATEYDEERIINYSSDGQKLEIEFNKMLDNCTIKGEAYEQFHLYILPLKDEIQLLIDCESLEGCAIQLLDLLRYLNTFQTFFVAESTIS